MLLQKIKKYFPILYIIFIIFCIYYVHSALKYNSLDVSKYDKSEDKKEIEVKPVKVVLELVTNSGVKIFNKSLLNTSSIDDLVLKVKKDDGLEYERIGYVHGYEFDLINGEKAPDGYLWRVFENGIDITFNTVDRKLIDGYIYRISLEKR